MTKQASTKAKVEAQSLLAGARADRIPDSITETLPCGLEVLFVVMSGDEIQLCIARAHQRFEQLGIDRGTGYGVDFENEIKWQIVFESMRDPADPTKRKKAARDTDEVRQLMTEEERDVYSDRQFDLQEAAGPDATNLTEETAVALLELIKKKADGSAQLSLYDSRTLRFFLLTLAEQPEISTILPSSIAASVAASRSKNRLATPRNS